MILTKSKIYEIRLITLEFVDKKYINTCIENFNYTKQTYDIYNISKEGYTKLIHYLIFKGAYDWDWGITNAAEGGHKKLIDYYISRGSYHWNFAMARAAKGGYLNLVEFFISKGITDYSAAIIYSSFRKFLKYFRDKMELN